MTYVPAVKVLLASIPRGHYKRQMLKEVLFCLDLWLSVDVRYPTVTCMHHV